MNMASEAVPLTSGYHHAGLTVRDLDASLKFFEAIGFNKVGGDPSYPAYFLLDANYTLLTLYQADKDAVSFDRRKNIGLHHLAIKVPTVEAVTAAYEAVIKVDGVKSDFAPCQLEGFPITHAMVFEPSGIRIEFAHQG